MQNNDRFILVHAPGGMGASMMRDKAIIEIRSVKCDDSEERAREQQRPMCPKSVHHTVYFAGGALDVDRDEAVRICEQLGIDPSFLMPEDMSKPISKTAN